MVRAKKWGVEVERIFSSDIFERDKWICHICGQEVPIAQRKVRVIGEEHDPMSPVVDHVIPLSEGGDHTLENCRTAHWTCNAKKYRTIEYQASSLCNEQVLDFVEDLVADSNNQSSAAKLCRVERCGRPVRAIRLCPTHYYRNRVYGDPLTQSCGCGCGTRVTVDPEFAGLYYVEGHGAVVAGPERLTGRPKVNTGVCKVEGCPRMAKTNRLCQQHNFRTKNYGDALLQACGCGCGAKVSVPVTHSGIIYISGHGVQSNVQDPKDRLAENVVYQRASKFGREKNGLTDECHIWTGSRHSTGYGRVYIASPNEKRKGSIVLTHRLAYEIVHGRDSLEGKVIDHLCAVKLCCNPNHLEAVTSAENLRRAGEMVELCPAGHPYDEANTYRTVEGYRVCRQCRRGGRHEKKHGHPFSPLMINGERRPRICGLCTSGE
ncbi:HNH endonuclease [Nocardia yamanashiensis]|uniref:HNH endonuclease n=1 Tax=Nocardia yamanashiensis TaxID=209247 RepID=UPI0038CD3286